MFKLSQVIIVPVSFYEVASGKIATVYLFNLSHDFLLPGDKLKCHVVVLDNAVIDQKYNVDDSYE